MDDGDLKMQVEHARAILERVEEDIAKLETDRRNLPEGKAFKKIRADLSKKIRELQLSDDLVEARALVNNPQKEMERRLNKDAGQKIAREKLEAAFAADDLCLSVEALNAAGKSGIPLDDDLVCQVKKLRCRQAKAIDAAKAQLLLETRAAEQDEARKSLQDAIAAFPPDVGSFYKAVADAKSCGIAAHEEIMQSACAMLEAMLDKPYYGEKSQPNQGVELALELLPSRASVRTLVAQFGTQNSLRTRDRFEQLGFDVNEALGDGLIDTWPNYLHASLLFIRFHGSLGDAKRKFETSPLRECLRDLAHQTFNGAELPVVRFHERPFFGGRFVQVRSEATPWIRELRKMLRVALENEGFVVRQSFDPLQGIIHFSLRGKWEGRATLPGGGSEALPITFDALSVTEAAMDGVTKEPGSTALFGLHASMRARNMER